jgi:predicted metal-dependent HD superfamily phosphohydrolase
MLTPWGAPAAAIESTGTRVLGCYAEPHRRYHTPEHLGEVLGMLGDLVDLAPDPVPVELAAWFHDVVYDPRAEPGANENASAESATYELGGLGVAGPVVASVRRLVVMTAWHQVDPGDVDGAVLADADLWILASPRSRYARYASDIRAEYGWLDDEQWSAGRSAVLAGFLDRPRIFATARAHDALDVGARANLGWELATLLRAQT